MTDFTEFEVDLDTERPNPNDNTKVLRGDAPRTAFTKYNDMLAAVHQVVRHIGPLAPSPTAPWMQWLDTSYDPPIERQRNEENTAWTVGQNSFSFQGDGVISVEDPLDSLYLGGGSIAPAETHMQAASLLRFWVNGVDRGRITNAGRMGLGSNSPLTILHISSADTGSTGFTIANSSAGGKQFILQSTGNGSSAGGGVFNIYDNTATAHRWRITSTGEILAMSNAIGYGAGAGGTVNQATSKSTGVTLNKPSGRIVTMADSLAAGAVVSFTLTNGSITQYDTVAVTIASTVTPGGYLVTVDSVVNGSCRISIRNMTSGALADTLGLNFTVTRGSIS